MTTESLTQQASQLITQQECLDKWNGTVPTTAITESPFTPMYEPFHMSPGQSGFMIFLIVLCLFLDFVFIRDAIRLKRMGSTSGAVPMLYCLIFCMSCMAGSLLGMVIVYW